MKRKSFLTIALYWAALGLAQGDESTSAVQQALKDQGFYYGEATGKMDADTTAALRRYQIRNGLKITGEVNRETEKSLGLAAATTETEAPTAAGSARPTQTTPAASASRDASTSESTTTRSMAQPPLTTQRPFDREPYRAVQPTVATSQAEVFADTPFETAPPPVQRQVILGAQTLLARRGYYRSGIDGVYGPGMEFALRAYQSRTGIPPNGRLDMDTLAALGLLPGQRMPGF
ncbi:MAG: peptidoglycan-binding domain-containing protein, partial [Chthoniobacterales bacterium]